VFAAKIRRLCKGAEVDFAGDTRRSNLRGIPPPKSEWIGRTWISTAFLLNLPSALAEPLPPHCRYYGSGRPGLTDREAGLLAGIRHDTMTEWRKDPEFSEAIEKATAERLLLRLNRIEAGEQGWQGTAWSLERLDPHRFARPEVMNQIAVVQGGKVPERVIVLPEADFDVLKGREGYRQRANGGAQQIGQNAGSNLIGLDLRLGNDPGLERIG
jgi:hypothetical protein